MDLLTGLVTLLVGALAGTVVPSIVRAVPEPADAEAGKTAYASIAAQPRLRPAAVAVCGVVLGVFGLTRGPGWDLLLLAPWVPLGVALAVIDWHTHRLPTWLLRPAYPVTVVLLLVVAILGNDGWADLRRAALGWAVVGGFYFAVNLAGPRLIGFGDVRLVGLLAPVVGFLGWGPLVVGALVPFVGQSLVGLGLVAWHLSLGQLRRRVPFGPGLLGGAAIGVVTGQAATDWYLRSAGLG